MKTTLLATLVLAGLAGGVAMTASDDAAKQAAKPAAQGEWIELFNGKDTTGWTAFVPDLKGKDQMAVWSVVDGCLKCAGNPIGYIRTTEQYDNFEL